MCDFVFTRTNNTYTLAQMTDIYNRELLPLTIDRSRTYHKAVVDSRQPSPFHHP